jgi:hypothetical protein
MPFSKQDGLPVTKDGIEQLTAGYRGVSGI